MKRFVALAAVFACSQTPEPTDTQEQGWLNTCSFKDLAPVINDCANIMELKCKDGMDEVLYVPAAGANWIGTPCYTTPSATYYFECGIVDGRAEVFCKNW